MKCHLKLFRKSPSPIFRVPERRAPIGTGDETDSVSSKEKSFDKEHVKSISTEDTRSVSATSYKSLRENSCVDGPKFDLGFDFSDDEDVIPPSPTSTGTQPFSQRSARSFSSNNLTRMKSFGQAMRKGEEEESKRPDTEWDDESQSLLLEAVNPSKGTTSVINSSRQVLKLSSTNTENYAVHEHQTGGKTTIYSTTIPQLCN